MFLFYDDVYQVNISLLNHTSNDKGAFPLIIFLIGGPIQNKKSMSNQEQT